MKKDSAHFYTISWCKKESKRILLETPTEGSDMAAFESCSKNLQQEATPIESAVAISESPLKSNQEQITKRTDDFNRCTDWTLDLFTIQL